MAVVVHRWPDADSEEESVRKPSSPSWWKIGLEKKYVNVDDINKTKATEGEESN